MFKNSSSRLGPKEFYPFAYIPFLNAFFVNTQLAICVGVYFLALYFVLVIGMSIPLPMDAT